MTKKPVEMMNKKELIHAITTLKRGYSRQLYLKNVYRSQLLQAKRVIENLANNIEV